MAIKRTVFICLFFILTMGNSYAQIKPSFKAKEVVYTSKNKKAIALYQESENYWFRRQVKQAIGLLNEAIKKDKKFAEAYLRLGSIYLSLGEYDKALVALEQTKALQADNIFFIDVYFLIARIHFENGRYEEALAPIKKFYASSKGKPSFKTEARKMLVNIEFAKQNIKKPVAFEPKELPVIINQMPLQYFPTITADDKEIFFTIRKGLSPIDDEEIYTAKRKEDGTWGNIKSISSKINSKFNEGTSTISADGRVLIFTSCNGRKVIGSCDLFYATRKGDEWTEPVNLGPAVNSKQWDSQPSLSADGNTLFFSSDRPGGVGRRDIWYSTRNEKGEWQKAKNIGKTINTIDDDLSPFLHVNGQTLYFASDGHPGFGSFDLYKSENTGSIDTQKWSEPLNLGYPINDFQEQVGLVVNSRGDIAYFSNENRKSKAYQKGKIYQFKIPESISVQHKSSYVTGRVLNALTGAVLDANIRLYKLGENVSLSSVSSDPTNGKYLMVLSEGADYVLYVNKEGFLFSNQSFSYSNKKVGQPITLDILLEPIQKGKITTLNNIFFEKDSYKILEVSVTELQRVYDFLKRNENIKIGVAGHTDNVGNEEYNLKLSKNRAKAVYDYLVSLGIPKERLKFRGYGETKPLTKNTTEEGKAKNRRIEFIVL